MDRRDLLNILYSKEKSPLEFQWDSLCGPGIFNYFNIYDLDALRKNATSIKLSGQIEKKYAFIDNMMKAKGFKKLGAGTNRVVYTCYENPSIVIKIAIDKVGMQDNPREYHNQYYLKPFVTKCFDFSPCGTVGIFERVEPVNSVEEFAYISDDVFELLTKCLLGKFVLEDIGSHFYNNYGVRKGFGVCLLDYPYMYELDGNKLICNKPLVPNTKYPVCGGEIDYDDGFNFLICSKCGRKYSARDLEANTKSGLIILKGGTRPMKISITRGNDVIAKFNDNVSNIIEPDEPKKVKNTGEIKASIIRPQVKVEEPEKVEEVQVESTTIEPLVEEKTNDVDTVWSDTDMSKQKTYMPAQEPIREEEPEVVSNYEEDNYEDYDRYKAKRQDQNRQKNRRNKATKRANPDLDAY